RATRPPARVSQGTPTVCRSKGAPSVGPYGRGTGPRLGSGPAASGRRPRPTIPPRSDAEPDSGRQVAQGRRGREGRLRGLVPFVLLRPRQPGPFAGLLPRVAGQDAEADGHAGVG